MPGNVIQRAKSRQSYKKAWMVGEPINGVGNYIFGRRNHTNNTSNNELFRRTPLGNTMPGNSAHLVPKINQLGGIVCEWTTKYILLITIYDRRCTHKVRWLCH